MSYQVEQHQIKKSNKWFDYCEVVCFASKNLFNTAQYSNRQSFIYGHGAITQAAMDKLFNSDLNYKSLPAKVSQLVLKQVADSWQSYFKALSAWKIDSSKFTGKPKMPGYIDSDGRNLIKFNGQAISKTSFKKGFISPSMSPIKVPVKPGLKLSDIVEVRLVPKVGCYILEVVYDDGIENERLNHVGLSAAIDIGIDNLATIVFSDPTIQPLAVNGKPLKSENQWFNKEVARLRSNIGFGTSHRIQNIIRNRNNFVHSYLHQAIAKIVKELDSIGVTEVAIGKNSQWKTNVNMGPRNNQQFVQIPHAKFILMLTSKLEKLGITVKEGEESYTSKTSFLDWDIIPTWHPGKVNQQSFSGKRIATKKYRSANGTVIHADVNGAFNIGRKVIPNSFDSLKLLVGRNSGCVVAHPRRINIPFKMTKLKDMSGSAHI
ncbi:transposase [Microcoleus sp. ARI1-B5]|uniref:RNA-guided endonuclease InsQ/TnpB family protein n=1 Tax=unclassified Microcoleus TaxID=2642155 RepID=UPI002FD1C340